MNEKGSLPCGENKSKHWFLPKNSFIVLSETNTAIYVQNQDKDLIFT